MFDWARWASRGFLCEQNNWRSGLGGSWQIPSQETYIYIYINSIQPRMFDQETRTGREHNFEFFQASMSHPQGCRGVFALCTCPRPGRCKKQRPGPMVCPLSNCRWVAGFKLAFRDVGLVVGTSWARRTYVLQPCTGLDFLFAFC